MWQTGEKKVMEQWKRGQGSEAPCGIKVFFFDKEDIAFLVGDTPKKETAGSG